MALGQAQDFRAVLQPAGSNSDLSTGLPNVESVAVTCRVFARLSIAVAEVAPAGWEERSFWPPMPATWDWMVTPRREGSIDGVLELKPAVQIESGGDVELRDLTVVPFYVRVAVDESLWDRLTRWTSNINVVQGLLVAVATLLTATLTLGGLRRRRRSGPESADGGGATAGADEVRTDPG